MRTITAISCISQVTFMYNVSLLSFWGAFTWQAKVDNIKLANSSCHLWTSQKQLADRLANCWLGMEFASIVANFFANFSLQPLFQALLSSFVFLCWQTHIWSVNNFQTLSNVLTWILPIILHYLLQKLCKMVAEDETTVVFKFIYENSELFCHPFSVSCLQMKNII